MRSKARSESVAQQRAKVTVFAVLNRSACIGVALQNDAVPLRDSPACPSQCVESGIFLINPLG